MLIGSQAVYDSILASFDLLSNEVFLIPGDLRRLRAAKKQRKKLPWYYRGRKEHEAIRAFHY